MPTRRGGILKPIVTAVLALVALFVLWLAAEAYFAITATPDIDTDYASQMEELAASVQGDGPNRWREFASVVADHQAAVRSVESAATERSQLGPTDFDFSVVYDEGAWLDDINADEGLSFDLDAGEELERFAAVRGAYVDALGSASLMDVAARLRELRTGDAVIVRPLPRDSMLIEVLLPELSGTRGIAQSIRARMFLASERGDWQEYTETVADGLWLAETAASDPILISGLVGQAVRAIVTQGVRQDVLSGRVPADALADLGDAFAGGIRPGAEHSLRGELLWGLDAVQHTHDQRGRLMVSRLPALQGTGQGAPRIVNMASVVLPRRKTTERAFRDYFDSAIERSAMTPAERRAAPPPPALPASPSNPVLDLMLPAVGSVIRVFEVARLEHLGLRTLIAIERHRAERGELPASLADLVPDYLDESPEDPWADDAPLVFHRDDSDLGYRLYSVGHDGEDNGGVRPAPGRRGVQDQDALKGDQPGTDYLFTRPPR